MNRKRTGAHGKRKPSFGRPPRKSSDVRRRPVPTARTEAATTLPLVEWPAPEPERLDPNRPFRVLIAVHRPRFRGRAERGAAFENWEVTSLLNKQDPVGLVARPPHPPDLLILSGDFGRQRDYAIFRAVQPWRQRGMKLVGLVEDCQTPPEGYPDSIPAALCDVCLEPPYTAQDLRALFARLYEQSRGRPAPN